MPDVVYAAADGLQVTLEAHAWTHIQHRHPEVALDHIVQALTNPARICDHNTEFDQRVYEGDRGMIPRWPAVFPVVIVERRSAVTGVVVTARLSRRPYQGVHRWP